ncbi:hypothetical protein CRUP_002921, partial [Coryphaenoides rupestris]
VTGESVVVELLKTERGNRTSLLGRTQELLNTTASTHKTVILASGYYAVFRVTLSAKGLEGQYNAALHITTDYEVHTGAPPPPSSPVSAQGKTVHHSFSIISSFSQRVRLLHIHSLSDDRRFYYRRLKTSRDELEPKRKSKAPGPGVVMQEDMWAADVDLYQMLNKRWKQLKESSQHIAEAVFEANADLQKNMQTRVLAQLKWPSIINSSRHVIFPLTSVNSSSEVEVLNFTEPVLIPSQGSLYIFSLEFRPLRPSTHVDSNILLVTNASKFHLPIRAYTGFLEPLALPPSLNERFLDFGVLSATDTSSILLAVFNSNPIEVILASGYYAVFRVTLSAKGLEGQYNAALHITTDYEILTIPVKAVIAVGTLTSHPKQIVLPPSFPVAKIYFDASLQCGDYCYVGLPFILKSEAPGPGVVMQEDMWAADVDLYQMLNKRWKQLKESSQHM